MEEFQKYFFTIIFRPKIVFLDTDSILRIKTMYESVKKDVLRQFLTLWNTGKANALEGFFLQEKYLFWIVAIEFLDFF